VEVLSPRLFRVELANGFRLLGHVSVKRLAMAARLQVGDPVKLDLSPYDLSAGRIEFKKEKPT
jgi:translation initiation factor IF-1